MQLRSTTAPLEITQRRYASVDLRKKFSNSTTNT
ncbi:unnamed protein product, partial [Rotaria socialis]